jgi:hypothetical protein
MTNLHSFLLYLYLAGFESGCHDPTSKAPSEKFAADVLELSVQKPPGHQPDIAPAGLSSS